MSALSKFITAIAWAALAFSTTLRADVFVDPALDPESGAKASWELEYEASNQQPEGKPQNKSGGVQVGQPIPGPESLDGQISTKTVTTTETVTRIPKPPVEKRVCEVTDSCDRLDTLRLIDEMQESIAVLDAQKRLSEARGAKSKALCEEAKACVGTIEFESGGGASFKEAGKALVASIYGSATSGYTADIIVNGSRVSVTEGEDAPDGSRVVKITPNSVVVLPNGGGSEVRLPFAGSVTGQ